VQHAKAAHEGVKHVEGGVLHVLASGVFVAFFLESPDDMAREEPKSKVHPRN
jgi:hypothetical protein